MEIILLYLFNVFNHLFNYYVEKSGTKAMLWRILVLIIFDIRFVVTVAAVNIYVTSSINTRLWEQEKCLNF